MLEWLMIARLLLLLFLLYFLSPSILQFRFDYSFLLFLKPSIMLKSPLIFMFFSLEISTDLFKLLFLQHLFHFTTHHTHFLVLVHFMVIKLTVFRNFRQNAELIEFLGCDIHQGTFLYFHVFCSSVVLSKLKIILQLVLFGK